MNIYEEIKRIGGGKELKIRENNANPYRVLVQTKEGMTAYYSSVPLYSPDKRLIIPKWRRGDGLRIFQGINAIVTATEEKVVLKNINGFAEIEFENEVSIQPTFNGILAECGEGVAKILLKTDGKRGIRENGSCFSLMQTDMIPFVTVGGIYGSDGQKKFPLTIESREIDETSFEITVFGRKTAHKLLFEINLYAEKMIFDTTVEEKNPDKNNAFGSVAFLGRTEEYGEQRLYTRFDCLQLLELNSFLVEEANLYLPKFGGENMILNANKLENPWCSFGSTWGNKIGFSDLRYRVRNKEKYEIVDVSDVIRHILRFQESRDPGIVIRGKACAGYSIVSTGDNYYRPQILEIKLKNY